MLPEVLNFEEDVLEASRTLPVLVDFWAPWCGPCRVLGPVLDRVAAADERFRLVKINTDEHPELMQRFGIRGIPYVKLFAGGAPVAEFTGALPEHAVKQWLDANLPSEAKARIAEARSLLDAGEHAAAVPLLESALAAEPGHPEAQVLLAQAVALSDPERARTLLDGADFAGAHYVQVAEAVRTLVEVRAGTDLPDGPGREPFARALAALDAGDPDAALEAIAAALQTDRYYADDAPRRLGVALFTLLGPTHDVTRKRRRLFDMLLY